MNKKIVGIFVCTLLILNVLPVMGATQINKKMENKDSDFLKNEVRAAMIENDDEYTIIDLGTLGGSWSYAGGLNDQCYVVGISSINNGAQHAFVWMCDMMTDIGTPEGFLVSGAVNVNDYGQVAGYANGAYQSQYAYIWENGNWTYLGTLPDLDYSTPYDINNPGQIVGHSFMLGPGGGSLAWIYEDGNMTSLGTLGGGRSTAFGINDEGQVVGASRTDNNYSHAFLWEDGEMTDIGVLPDEDNSAAYDINENGQICGASSHTLNQYPFPTFVTACVWDGDEIIEIEKLSGYTRNNAAGGINDQGQVVGYSSDNGNNPHPFIWEDGEVTDLNDLLPEGSGWELKTAADINEQGEIVGYGKINGETHGYLLIAPSLNQQPIFSNEVPIDGSTDIPITTTSLNVTIEDSEGDSFDWSIETSPDVGSNSNTEDVNGSKTCSISGLNYDTSYTWYVNATDSGSGKTTEEVYMFTTEDEPQNYPPMFSNENPPNGETNVPITITDLSLKIEDPEGDSFDWSIETSPDVGSNSAFNDYNGSKTCSISGLNYDTSYTWYVNATDSGSGKTTEEIYLFTTEKENNPPDIPIIDGPSTGKPGVEYTYCIVASDPDNDSLFVLWSWGDGTSSEWGGPYESGTEVCDSHVWNETGTFTISVTVKDEYGESVTAIKEVTMPRNKVITNPFLHFLKNHPNIFPLLQKLIQKLGIVL